MKKLIYIKIIIAVVLLAFFIGCDKYKNIITSGVSGTVILHDTLNVPIQTPLSGVTVKLNSNGADTSAYISQALTDSLGDFAIPYFGKDGGSAFVNNIKSGIKYAGITKISSAGNSVQQVTINVFPVYKNGLSITFLSQQGVISNFPFRLYLNYSAAKNDSTKFAYVSSQTNVNGVYRQYNILPNKYYITAKDSVSGKITGIIDSVTIGSTPLNYKQVTIKP